MDSVIGGIGIVFDLTAEFKAILNEILPHEEGQVNADSRALFTTEQDFVVASSQKIMRLVLCFF
ncbi:hypothetical protein [Marinomonas profundimaris]|uniref:Uncharacterized protein n=1 Tax=Marinomonas profundimaris TaxID=1208321 RepID=W1RUB9_9GAMM|nr:hypothetical protein [Marinomonas profundimaris]ETI58453.1 hypothetical protein D104_15275 [Marinomonas profundimaris]